MVCPSCGAQADLVDQFCARCGTTLRAQRLPAIRRSELPASRHDSRTRGLVRQAMVLAAGALLPVVARSAVRLMLRSVAVQRLAPGRQGVVERISMPRGGRPLEIETRGVIELHTVRYIRPRR